MVIYGDVIYGGVIWGGVIWGERERAAQQRQTLTTAKKWGEAYLTSPIYLQ